MTSLGYLPTEGVEEAMPESFQTNRVVTEEPLNVTVSDVAPGTILCVVAGEVDLVTAPGLRDKLTDAINDAPSHLVIDLSGVQFLASIGLSVLVEILAAQEAASRHLAVVVENNDAVTQSLQITGLDQVFDFHVAVETAIAACPAPTTVQRP
ncbi:MAG: STAS domain-containing protein [Pseudonocardiaceae bacterium]